MGTYANFFVEVKLKGSDKWEMVKFYRPFIKHTHTYESCGELITEETFPDIPPSENNEKGLTVRNSFWRQGHVRDIFSGSGWNDVPFAKRGLPDDMSDDVKAYFDKEYARIEEENKKNIEKYGKEHAWLRSKWWWSETYVSMSELEGELDKEINEWKEKLTAAFKEKFETTPLMAKMDEVIAVVKGDKPKRKRKTGKEDYDDTEYYLEEVFYDILQLNNFINKVDNMAEEYAPNEVSEIRVISYCD